MNPLLMRQPLQAMRRLRRLADRPMRARVLLGVLAGAIFAAAMARTAGSIIGGLAALAPWAFVFAAALALLLALGGMLRIRRRLRSALLRSHHISVQRPMRHQAIPDVNKQVNNNK